MPRRQQNWLRLIRFRTRGVEKKQARQDCLLNNSILSVGVPLLTYFLMNPQVNEEYHYPDSDDKITLLTIKSLLTPNEHYWDESEKHIITEIQRMIAPRSQAMLDAGCGTGRLLPDFANLFSEVVGIDADPIQLTKAVELLQGYKHLQDRISLVCSNILDYYPNRKFDFILVSHILQHVSTSDIDKILYSISSLLSENGFAAILTNHSCEPQDYFELEQIVHDNVVSSRTDENTHNTLVNNKSQILPIHYFTEQNLTKRLNAVGLTVERSGVFHCVGDFGGLDTVIFRDTLVNAHPTLAATIGRDMYMLCRKQ